MKKESILWKIFIKKCIKSDGYNDEYYINDAPLYRHGYSKKQVENRLRKTMHLRDHDENDGQVSVTYVFEMTKEEKVQKKDDRIISIFDEESYTNDKEKK